MLRFSTFSIAPVVAVLAISNAAVAQDLQPNKGIVDEKPADSRSVETDDGWMVAYNETIPGTSLTFEMLPIPGGVVRVPVNADEGEPAYCEVDLPPYWIGKCEVTWAEYRKYMELDSKYSQLQQLATLRSDPRASETLRSTPKLASVLTGERAADAAAIEVDAVTAPTPLYDPSTTYESGEDEELPAVTMSPFAARQYTKWLSALSKRDYRLPSEAEWLHAAAAAEPIESAVGNPDRLDDVAWYADNSDYLAHHVGKKQPNAWGLHDTLGNAAEQVLDAATPKGRPQLAGKRVSWGEAVAWPDEGEARLAMGGWYDAEADEISLTARMATDEDDWKASDPNLPRSPWWYADYPATGVGFRLARPLKPIPEELKQRVWDTVDPVVVKAVTERLREGRGKLGPIGADLPKVLEELDSKPVRRLLK